MATTAIRREGSREARKRSKHWDNRLTQFHAQLTSLRTTALSDWIDLSQRKLLAAPGPGGEATCEFATDEASMIRVNQRIAIAEDEVEFDFIRSSGPGGQNVNKVSTAVRLRFDVRGSRSLPDDVRERLIRLAGKRVGDDGFLTIHARRCRTQESNRREAIERLVELVQAACERPKLRRPTKPTAASQERRLNAKRRRGETKQERRTRDSGDD